MSVPTDHPQRQPPGPALVGRERELALLREALDAALVGHGTLVLIDGEAGIGKTALAETLLAEAATRGAVVLVGRCYDLSETPPYGPWVEALARAPRDTASPPPDLAGGGQASQAALFTALSDYLAALVAHRPLVLLLDDLHWADPASLDLLRFVARQLGDLPLLLLANYRAHEVAPGQPLFALLPLLAREARAERLDLRPLNAAAIETLVAVRHPLPDADRARLADYLAARTEGNALFLSELLRTLEGEGLLRREGDRWVVGELERVPVPLLLRQVIEARVTGMGESTRVLLATAAVIGQEVPLALWVSVAGVGEDVVLVALERAVAAHLLAGTPDGGRFAHALVREALYESILPVRRGALHRRAAEALLATPAPDPDAVAYHFQQVRDPRAAAWLIAAGERAQRSYAWLTAAARYEAALALLGDDPARAGERGWLLLRLAQVRELGDARRNLTALDEAARLATVVGDRALAAAALFAHGLVLHQSLMDLRAGRPLLEAGLAAVEALRPEERARLDRLERPGSAAAPGTRYLGTLVWCRGFVGPFPEVVALGERFAAEGPAPPLGQGLDPGSARSVGPGYEGLAIARALLGRPVEARQAFAAARAAWHPAGDHYKLGGLAELELKLVTLPYDPERVAARRHLAAEVAAQLGRAGAIGPLVPQFFCVPLLALEGAWAEARALASEVRTAGANAGARRAAMAWLGTLARAQGEPALAWAQVRVGLPDGPATAPDDIGIEMPRLLRLAAALALDAGDMSSARAWLETYDRWLAWSGAVLWRAEGQLVWAAYHRAAGNDAPAREYAETALASAGAPRQPLALLATRRLLGEWDTTDGHYTEALAHLEAALALAEACAAPYERALTLLALAELRAAEGRRDEASTALDEARALLEPLAARPALARADALVAHLAAPEPAAPVALPFGLTAREAEVLALLAEGLTDQQIGDRLFVSVHTVKTHLRAVYGKLGVPSRTAAARLATAHGLA